MVYSTASYNSAEQVMNFEVHGHRNWISKVNLCKLLGLSSSPDGINPNSVAIYRLIVMFHQMGYTYDLSLLPKFRKSTLPPIENALFTILFKCLLERVTGSDNASKFFYTLIYGLFSGENVDYGKVF